jgi:ribosome-associated translation inhibitor RaiA
MRLHIEGEHTDLSPHMLSSIAEQLEALNTPYKDIFHARITLVQHEQPLQGCYETRVTLILDGKTLHATRGGATLADAADVALKAIARALRGFRTRQFIAVN